MCIRDSRNGVQWLDESVHATGIRIRRKRNGRLGLERTFRFEYSRDGSDRHAGSLSLLGGELVRFVGPVREEGQVNSLNLDVYKRQIAGRPWFDATHQALDPEVRIDWRIKEGDRVSANTVIATLEGQSRALVTAERTSLNFLQTLSGTATTTCLFYTSRCV